MMFLVCAFAMLAFGWMLLLPGLFTSVIENRTGFPARVESFYANPFTGEVRMRGLVMANPPGFSESRFIDLQQFSAKADLFSLLGGNPVIDMTTLDVARITVVTNAQGANNLDLVYRRLAGTVAPKKSVSSAKSLSAGSAAPAASTFQFLVRSLDVRLNEVVVKDERPGKTVQNVHQLSFQRSYSNVTPATDFSANLPVAVAAAGKNVGEVVTGNLKQIVTRATQPMDRKTYAWGDKRENSAQARQ